MELFLVFVAAYFTAYKLGIVTGEARERHRQDRSDRKAEDKVVYLKERR